MGARLSACAEVRAARHAGDGFGLQRATWPRYGIARSRGHASCATYPTRTVCSTAPFLSTSATSGWKTSSHGSASWCARSTPAWWTNGRAAGTVVDAAPPTEADAVVRDRRGLTVLVRNALFRRVRLAAAGQRRRSSADAGYGVGLRRSRQLASKRSTRSIEAHEEILLDADARSTCVSCRSTRPTSSANHVWHVRQIFRDADGDRDFGICGRRRP